MSGENQGCKGIVYTADKFPNSMDPDNLEISIDWTKLDQSNIIKDPHFVPEYVDNYKEWAKQTSYDKTYCISCAELNGEVIKCSAVNADTLIDAQPFQSVT